MTDPVVTELGPCPSDFQLDQFDCGEASQQTTALCARHRDQCPHCATRFVVRAAASRAFLGEADVRNPFRSPAAVSALDRRPGEPVRSRSGRHPWRVLAWAAPALAAGLALFVLHGRLPSSPRADQIRTKGGLRMGFFVRRGDNTAPGGPFESVHPGDALQFTVHAPSAGFVAILSLDANGQASVYFPEGSTAAAVEAGEQVLPQSTVLDRVLGSEHLVAVLCPHRFDAEDLRRRLAKTAPGGFQVPGCLVDSTMIKKVLP